ncbi:MAG: uracil-DNA glycosylase [Tepidisphaeraceae bacterium]
MARSSDSNPDPSARRARARLGLRAEKALGLGAVGVKRIALGKKAGAGTSSVSSSGPSSAPASAASPPPAKPRLVPAPKPAVSGVASPAARPAVAVVPDLLEPPPIDLSAPPMPTAKKVLALKQLNETEVVGCTKCRLHETRTQTVFGEGDADAQIVFIGEGPGENEDLQGRPFVGKAGQLLDKMILAMGLSREQVYICNIVKCRPPNNRQPAPDETATCTPYLLQQLQIVRPKVIVTLGLPASQYILRTKNSMTKMRGQWHDWNGLKVMPTYHPAYVLRAYTRQTREAVWSDLQAVLAELKLPLPPRREP